MERLNSSQQTHNVTELDEQATPVSTQEVTSITPRDSNTDYPRSVPPLRRHLLPIVILGMLLGAGAIASGLYAYRRWEYAQEYAQRYQETDNAYVTADIHKVTAPVSGIVSEVSVKDNEIVSPKKVLVRLDKRDYQLALSQAKASLELAKQQAALAQKKIEAATINTSLLKKDTTTQPTDNTNQILQVQALNQQKEISQQEYKTAQAMIAEKEAELKKAELDLSYTNITPLVGGKVANVNVRVGERVEPGQNLITIVQPRPWIVANFKETQLEKIQPGQKVEIKIAAFPNQKFSGRVDSMSPTSFGRFTFPEDNPANASTQSSDVQRIPVKIVFDSNSLKGFESRITPGMSAVAVVEIK
jgi:membrane fusion protein (multidrug efflux system)